MELLVTTPLLAGSDNRSVHEDGIIGQCRALWRAITYNRVVNGGETYAPNDERPRSIAEPPGSLTDQTVGPVRLHRSS